MNKHLFLLDLRLNRVLIIAFTLVLTMYGTIAAGMYDPQSADAMQSMLEILPEGMADMFSFNDFGTNMNTYLASYLYGFIFFIFPMIYIVLAGCRLVAKHVDSGSMGYLLTTPNTRRKIAVTQASFLVFSVAFIIFFNTFVIILMGVSMFPGELAVWDFIMLNTVTVSVLLFVASLVFLASVWFQDLGRAYSVSGTVAGLFFISNMLKNLNDDLMFFRFFTPLSLVDSDKIYAGGMYPYLTSGLALLGAFSVFYVAVRHFETRSLTI